MESFHGKLRDECLNTSWFGNLFEARAKIGAWKEEYKEERPHSSLGYLAAATRRTDYDSNNLMYVARTRNGFVPASRRQVFSKLKHLVAPECPFVNLPETKKSRFGEELNAEKMKKAVWLKPEIVAQIEFLEWTDGDRLRHSKFVGLREDKNSRSVVKELTP